MASRSRLKVDSGWTTSGLGWTATYPSTAVAPYKSLLPVALYETVLPIALYDSVLPVALYETVLPIALYDSVLPHVVRRWLRQGTEDAWLGGGARLLAVPPDWPRLHAAGTRVVSLQRDTRQIWRHHTTAL